MKKIEKRRVLFAGVLALLFSIMQVDGWQRSMKYGTSMYTSPFLQNIGILDRWQCLLMGVIGWIVFGVLLYFLFGFFGKSRTASAENSKQENTHMTKSSALRNAVWKYIWPISAGFLFLIYLIYVIGCYPGYYNYDGSTQLVQVMYEEIPYDAHHPLLHTLFFGGIINLGYQLYNVDLTFGVFLHSLAQMTICAVCFGYSVCFVYRHSGKRLLAILAFVFYAICPPIIMFGMSTTKDIICYAVLLVAILKLYGIYWQDAENGSASKADWVTTGGLLTLSCLLRNNIVYAIFVMALVSLIYCLRKRRMGFVFLFGGVILASAIINTGLETVLKAESGAATEALSVPFQQIARLYYEEGESAFSEEELTLLYAAIEPEMLTTYNPMISDPIKYAFWRHWDVITEYKWEYLSLWLKKGLQYPDVYLDSFLDNTYQAWYPATVLGDINGSRYFDITGWQDEFGSPKIQGLYDYYEGVFRESSYARYPILRMFFSTGAMLWLLLITWVYGLWKKDYRMVWALLPVLLVCGTNLLGPVSDLRYYLILFYLCPVCVGFLAAEKSFEKI